MDELDVAGMIGLFGVLPTIDEPETEPEREWPRLADFLTARYDELEDEARAASPERLWAMSQADRTIIADAGFMQTFTPAHVLADLASKRALLARHTPDRGHPDPWAHTVDEACSSYSDYDHTIVYEDECQVMAILAWPFRDHDDYNPAWARYLPASLTGEGE